MSNRKLWHNHCLSNKKLWHNLCLSNRNVWHNCCVLNRKLWHNHYLLNRKLHSEVQVFLVPWLRVRMRRIPRMLLLLFALCASTMIFVTRCGLNFDPPMTQPVAPKIRRSAIASYEDGSNAHMEIQPVCIDRLILEESVFWSEICISLVYCFQTPAHLRSGVL